tara:strand:+ start:1047 stop:1367 length:321 start_codon:yes stop_codon:yes gene_type:complete
MSANPTQNQTWFAPRTGSQFARLGYPGKYHSAIKIAGGATTTFTASLYGYGAVLIGTGGAVADTKIHVAGGAIIDGNDLIVGTIYPIAVEQVVANTGDVFVFKVQQ